MAFYFEIITLNAFETESEKVGEGFWQGVQAVEEPCVTQGLLRRKHMLRSFAFLSFSVALLLGENLERGSLKWEFW